MRVARKAPDGGNRPHVLGDISNLLATLSGSSDLRDLFVECSD
jgi:hypothetical protein